MNHQPHLTDAQFRMLGYAWTEQRKLLVSRYRAETATISALLRKGLIEECIEHVSLRQSHTRKVWTQTKRGRAVYAAHGRNPVAS